MTVRSKVLRTLPALAIAVCCLFSPVMSHAETGDAEYNAELSKYGIDGTKLPQEDPSIDLNTFPITNKDRANIGFTMYLDPDSDLFDSSDTYVSFQDRTTKIRFLYTFSHFTDYDRENNVCKGIIQIPADNYFNDYDISVFTKSNGFNGGNLYYQETIQPVAGQTYGLYAAAGSNEWLQTEGAKLLKKQAALGDKLVSDEDAKAIRYEQSKKETAKPKAKSETKVKTVQAEDRRGKILLPLTGKWIFGIVIVFVLLGIIKKVRERTNC
ncbi:MAG: hypothetical protein ACOYIG_13270 [Acetivibrionales bacterium]|jgi:hypothetical protein